MEAYITSIHIKQFKCALQHYWSQVYSCLFWLASTMIIHNWKDMINNSAKSHYSKTSRHHYGGSDDSCCISDHEEDEEDEDYEEEEEEDISDDEAIKTESVAPWSKERRDNEETSTLHSFDTSISSSHQSESKSFVIKKKKMMALNNLKNQMTAWKQKHFQKAEIRRTSIQNSSSPSSNNGLIKLFSKKHSIDQRPRISLTTFRRKTSPDIY